MSYKTKVFNAACESGKVTVNGAEVPGAVIVSAGQAKSQGVALFCGPDVVYVAVPVDTLKTLIGFVGDLATAVASGVLPANVGGPITSGTFAADLAQIKQACEKLKEHIQ